jgi:hypothetical protein
MRVKVLGCRVDCTYISASRRRYAGIVVPRQEAEPQDDYETCYEVLEYSSEKGWIGSIEEFSVFTCVRGLFIYAITVHPFAVHGPTIPRG